jgi:hypothetical protein
VTVDRDRKPFEPRRHGTGVLTLFGKYVKRETPSTLVVILCPTSWETISFQIGLTCPVKSTEIGRSVPKRENPENEGVATTVDTTIHGRGRTRTLLCYIRFCQHIHIPPNSALLFLHLFTKCPLMRLTVRSRLLSKMILVTATIASERGSERVFRTFRFLPVLHNHVCSTQSSYN